MTDTDLFPDVATQTPLFTKPALIVCLVCGRGGRADMGRPLSPVTDVRNRASGPRCVPHFHQHGMVGIRNGLRRAGHGIHGTGCLQARGQSQSRPRDSGRVVGVGDGIHYRCQH